MSREKIMNCDFCSESLEWVGTIYLELISALCPACEDEHREYLHLLKRVEVPSHIPKEQRQRYLNTIIGRQVENNNRQ
jgi:hypothetical protein